MGHPKINRHLNSIIILTLWALTAWVYWSGLSGPFLFDDFGNIAALGDFNGVRNWETFKLFVFGNQSGPTGRPIAMLSFLINDTNWPSDPWSFKFTNLILHLLNGALLYTLVFQICLVASNYDTNHDARWIAGLSMALWILHPFNVSTVLYPVQRMAILATFFTLLGLLAYIYGRQLIAQSLTKAYALMSLGLFIAAVLAALSKENGALLPILALCIEITIFGRFAVPLNRYWKIAFLWLPLLMLAGYFFYGLISGNLQSVYITRPFTLSERILTQPRILFDYLYYWFIPHIGSPGLLTQDFPISRSILEPPTTLIAILGIAGLILSTFLLRKKFPIYSLSLLFYFAGHLVESTIIPLEMDYEHRNYLPALLLFLPLSYAVVKYSKSRNVRLVATLFIIAIPLSLTNVRADIWSSEESLAYHWAHRHPGSQRALRHAAQVAKKNGKYSLALNYLEQAKHKLPDNIAIQLHWLTLSCRIQPVSDIDKRNTLAVMENGYFNFRSFNLLNSTINFIASPQCHGVDINYAYSLISALRKNPAAKRLSGARFQLYTIEGILDISQRNPVKASENFRSSLQEYPHLDAAMVQIALLASSGYYQQALEHIEFTDTNIPLDTKLGQIDYHAELQRLRNIINNDIKQSESHTQ